MIEPLTKKQKALLRILRSDIHAPQFLWKNDDRVTPYRVFDYQYYFEDANYGGMSVYAEARATGKSEKQKRRSFTLPFRKPGRGRLISAPRENHLNPVMEKVIDKLEDVRLTKELIKRVRRKPYYIISFKDNAEIIGKIPGKDGASVKGEHVDEISIDEGQDYPDEGYENIRECLNEVSDKEFVVYGVHNGVRNTFFNLTRDNEFQNIVITAMHKLSWGEKERREKVKYYGSRRAPAYVRNIYAEPGDALNLVFLPSKLSRCIDWGIKKPDGTYDKDRPRFTDDYVKISIINEDINRNMSFEHYLRFPETHKKYKRVWVGADLAHQGEDPTEILIWVEEVYKNKNRVRLICRIHCERLTDDDQVDIFEEVCKFYNVTGVALDATARGGSIWQKLSNRNLGNVYTSGYNFKAIKEVGEDDKGNPIRIQVNQLAIETLRNMCDHMEFIIPYDEEMITDWMGLKVKPLEYGKFKIVDEAKYKPHTLYASGMMALQRDDYRMGRLQEEEEVYAEGGWVDEYGITPGATS